MKSNNLSKKLTIVVALIAFIGIALFINVSAAGEDAKAIDSAVSPLIAFSQYLLYVTIAVTLFLSIRGLFRNPENLKKALKGVAALAVLLAIAYFLGDSNAVLDAQGLVLEGGEAGSSANHWVGVGIWFSLILGTIGGLFFVFDLAKGLVKS